MDVQIRRCPPVRRKSFLSQALCEDRKLGSVSYAEEGWRKVAQDRPDHQEALLEEDVHERPAATIADRCRFLDPIEETFSKIKGTTLRKVAARRREALVEAMGKALDAVTVTDARSFFEHCGFRAMVQPF